MKKLFFVFCLLFSFGSTTQGQGFQGVIKFSINLMGENAAMAQAFMPTAFTYTIGSADMLVEMEGGMMAAMMGKILVLGKKGQTYVIKDSEKQALLITGAEQEEEKEAPVITKEDEIITILGYECQKYKLEMELDGVGTLTQYVWATDKIQLPKFSSGTVDPGRLAMKGINGLPLKTMVSVMGMTQVMTATEIDKTPPAKSALKIPKGYKKGEITREALMGGMGG